MTSPRRLWTLACAGFLAALAAGCASAPQAASDAPPAPPLAPGAVKIATVDQRFMREAQFKRITEYFTDKENNGGRVVVRTDPARRDGYYFILGLNWPTGAALPAGCVAQLEYVRMDSPAPRQAEFTLPATGTWPEIFLGLTGDAWPTADYEILAYKITLKNRDGSVIAERQSFLWSLPSAKGEAPAAPTVAAAPPAAGNPAPAPAN